METSQRRDRFLHKLPQQIRRHWPRHKSSDAVRSSTDDIRSKSFPYSLQSAEEIDEAMSMDQCTHAMNQTLITGHNKDSEPLVEYAASPVPKYTPVPIPSRNSSARHERHQQHDQNSAKRHDSATDDDVSFHLEGFERESSEHGRSTPTRREKVMFPQPPRYVLFPPPRYESIGNHRASLEKRLKVTDRHSVSSLQNSTKSSPRQTAGFRTSSNGPPGSQATKNGLDRSRYDRLQDHLRHGGNQRPPMTSRQQSLPALQNPVADRSDVQNTELNNVDDPDNWDVLKPVENSDDGETYSLETRAEQLYSAEHLTIILEDPKRRLKFSNFLRKYRPWRLPVLNRYWKSYKAIKALSYANSLLGPLADGNRHSPGQATNGELANVAHEAFEELRRDDLHYFIAHSYIQIVSAVVQRRITGNLAAHLRETSQGLAEVFCVTDPTRRDNPIILASQEFTRHSGCNLRYILGRNCNFLQGPGTTVDSRRRFAISCAEARDHTEIFVNYRRDGSPFLSLVMNAPLIDSRGNVRYFLGAQVDISGLLKECSGLDSLRKLVDEKGSRNSEEGTTLASASGGSHNEIKALSQFFNAEELDIIRRHGGYLSQGSHYVHDASPDRASSKGARRVLIEDNTTDTSADEDKAAANKSEVAPPPVPPKEPLAGNLEGVYRHYLLVRPYPSFRVLFASPRLRQPGILQSHFLHRIGGGRRMQENLAAAFREGNAVTAKVRWLDVANENGEGEGRSRWVHCTPLMHYENKIGMWMVVVVMPDARRDEDLAAVERGIARGVKAAMSDAGDAK